ncbi:hypothetical protein BC938DRAFT_479538 [Jimgerdemannia flammicorona]|uniref:Uncharacterized protein n=1 Tax=Jimgerdemannia flammicorona TaxID=994334 RepID=A0A433QKM2_9FUNG|nr:hypothetical protein BC938DRAFT_479538 [Jimgerdemannia flammicorona]
MGKLDKNKQLAKTKKIPIRVNPAWYDIIIEYKNSHPDSVLHAATEALEKFAADADATWDQQTLYLKEAELVVDSITEKALETRPNKSSKSATSNIRLAPPSASQIHSVIEPIACAAYFAAPEVPPRRHCIPIIDICHALLPSTCFLREYDHYITHDIASPYAAQPVAQKALAIYTTLDFSLGTTVVRQRLLETIRYLVECLGVAVQKAEAMIPEDRESQGPPATAEPETAGSQTSRALILQQIMSDVQYTTKTLLALLSRHPGDLRPLFDIRSAMPEDHRLISRLLDYSITVCTHARLYTNECGQLSGMAIAAVLDLLGDPEFVRETTLELFFVAPESSSPRAKALIQNLGVIVPADVKGELGWLDDDAPMLNIVKGLLANLGKPVLLTPIPKSLQFLKKGLISPRYPSNLHHLLFTAIAHFCSQSNLDQQCKVVAFETMAIWLTTTRDLLQESNDKRFGTPFTNGFVDTIRSVLDENASDQVLGYVWNLWDDPVDAIQHKVCIRTAYRNLPVRSIFETLLEVVDIRSQIEDTRETYQMFLGKLLARLMRMDWHRKVKFALLSLLLPKIGTEPFLAAQPDLVWQTLQVHSSLVLAPRASSLLISFLEQRWQETKSAGGRSPGNEDVKQSREEVIEAWTQLWLSSLCRSLTSSSDVLRRNIVGHALQAIFKICPESFWKVVHVLERREVGKWSSPLSEYMITDEAYRMNALIAVIKVGRSLDLIEGDSYANDELPTNPHQISIQTLLTAIHHVDPNLRIDTLGLICESRKSTAEVTRVEIDLLRAFLPLNMNCTSPDFRQKFSGHITKFFTRLRGSLFAQYRNYQSRLAYVQKNTQKPQENIQAAQAESVAIKATIDYAHNFLLWLVEHIAASLYPGSSYQRISTALRLLSLLIKIFGIDRTPAPEGFAKAAEFPFQLPIATVRNVKLLLDCLTNPFDGNRMQAYEVLVAFPCPLPGFEEREEVQRLLWWALESVTSTRAGESDGGAIVFRLIFVKYVVGLGFDLDVEVAKASELVGTNHERGSNVRQESAVFKISASEYSDIIKELDSNSSNAAPDILAFAHKLCNLLQKQINIASTNLLRAAQSHPMHGSLLALQYLFSELDYNSALVKDNLVLWRRTHDQVILLVNRVCATVMDVLSNPSPEGNMPASFQEMEETIEEMIEELEEGDFDGTAIRESGPKHQVILSCCWRAVKEASSLLGVILLRAPLAVSKKDSSAFLDHEDIVDSGNLFRNLLTSIRHRGAFSAVYPSYVSLCARLLSAPQASFSDLPSIWLQDHIANITSSNISVTRRSAGLPLCILAIVSGEPAYRKPLLTATMKRLVKIASEGPADNADQALDLPQVHALNILRTIFMDAKLGTDILPYLSDGLSLAIDGFSSPSWAVRNCSVMLFSTLLQRTFGTKKTKDEHNSMNNLTSREFFTRFPHLLRYLLRELEIAVKQLLMDQQVPRVHPGLYPILTLLSRLHPALMDESDTELTMTSFVPLVMSCASSSIFKVWTTPYGFFLLKTREMTARALVPLIASTNLVPTVIRVLDSCSLTSQNELHGRLLQVQFLLRGHLYNVTSHEVMEDFVTHLPRVIASKLDILMPANPCNITRALMLDIITEFFIDSRWINLHIGDDKQDLIKSIAQKFADVRGAVFNQCAKEMFNGDNNKPGLSVGHYLLRQQMAKIIVLSVWSGLSYLSDILATDAVMKLLGDDDYEVRLVTLELLNKYMVAGPVTRYDFYTSTYYPPDRYDAFHSISLQDETVVLNTHN